MICVDVVPLMFAPLMFACCTDVCLHRRLRLRAKITVTTPQAHFQNRVPRTILAS
jgi:hypothetical protein